MIILPEEKTGVTPYFTWSMILFFSKQQSLVQKTKQQNNKTNNENYSLRHRLIVQKY